MIRTIVFNDTRVDRHHGSRAVMDSIEKALLGRLSCHFDTVPAHFDWRQHRRTRSQMDAADLVLINAEGTLHHNAIAGGWLLEAVSEAHATGKPVAVINMSWQDNNSDWLEVLGQADLISARDQRSRQELIAAGLDVRYVPDLSIGPTVMPVSKRHGIGFTDSVLRDVTRVLSRQCRRMNGSPISIQYPEPGMLGTWRYLRAVVARSDLEHPAELCRLVNERYRLLRAAEPTLPRFLDRLKRLRLLVSGRYHACTFAVLTNTPFIAAGTNTGKIDDLIDDVGLDPARKSPELSEEMIHHFLVLGWSEEEASRLREFRRVAQESQQQLFNDIATLVAA